MDELQMQARFIYTVEKLLSKKRCTTKIDAMANLLKTINSNFSIEGHTVMMVVMNTTKVFLMTELLLLKKL
jgi:hypothetical protein